jgi:hypothetical protein
VDGIRGGKIYPESEAKNLKSLKKWFDISPMRTTSPGSRDLQLESGFFCFSKMFLKDAY